MPAIAVTDRTRVLLSWSSGKDSAWALKVLRDDPSVDVVGLLTTINDAADRVAMHAVRRRLVERQAAATGLPLLAVPLPWPCSNDDYEAAMRDALARATSEISIDAVAFGDLFLEDVRAYREERMQGTGVVAHLTAVDPKQCPAKFAGRRFDRALLDELPAGVDRCGENGEFHTFVSDVPVFSERIDVAVGDIVEPDGFVFADIDQA